MDLKETSRLDGSDVDALFDGLKEELEPHEQRLMDAVQSSLFGTQPPGDITIDRYVLQGRLGSGGMGVVFRALDPDLGRPVAIKFLNADVGSERDSSAGQRRLLREARLIARVRHSNVVAVHDVRPYDTLPPEVASVAGVTGISMRGVFLVMELVDGDGLGEWQARPETSRDAILAAYLAAGRGLAAVHRAGLVHRDFKPDNVLVGRDGSVRVLDFGLARTSHSALADPTVSRSAPADDMVTEAGSVVGTPRYMAPEQFSGANPTARADVFAFCFALYEALTGTLPYASSSPRGLIEAKRRGDLVDPPRGRSVPRWCQAIIRRGLAPDPSRRFPHMGAVVAAIERGGKGRSNRIFGVAGLGATVAVAGLMFGSTPAPPPSPPAASVTAAPVPTAADRRVVAVLPFAVAVEDERLATARDTLPFILVEGLAANENLRTIDYFVVRHEVEPPGAGAADDAAWRDASLRAGAGVLVRGRVDPADEGLRLQIDLESADGEVLGTVVRSGSLADLSAAMRDIATEAASTVLGVEAGAPSAGGYAWDYDTVVAEGAQAVEEGNFPRAITRLEEATAMMPDAADAWFYLAISLVWQELPVERALEAIERAIDAGIGGARKAFLVGYRHQVRREYEQAIPVFKEAVQRYPSDRYLTYGLFESLYHGGHPREAMDLIERGEGGALAIRRGAMHLLDYYEAHGWAPELERALAQSPGGIPHRIRWARFLGDYEQALSLTTELDPDAYTPKQVMTVRTELLALSGQIDLAVALAEPLARGRRPDALPAMALHAARDDEQARRRFFWMALQTATQEAHELQRGRAIADLVVLSVPIADDDALRSLADLVGPFDPQATQAIQLSTVLLALALRDPAELDAAVNAAAPEVRACAEAGRAELGGDLAMAAARWTEAIESSLDGRFITVERWHLARLQRALGNLASAADTCAAVLRPPAFHWSWGATVRPCLEWTVEAATQAGDEVAAAAARGRLDALRAG